jgi:hypothetical protein
MELPSIPKIKNSEQGALASSLAGDGIGLIAAGALVGGLVGAIIAGGKGVAIGGAVGILAGLAARAGVRRNPPPLVMAEEVYLAIRDTVGSLTPEQGGILGGDPDTNIVTHYAFDPTAQRSSVAYSPDVLFLNDLLKREWNPKGIRFLGFVHSHPRGLQRPSSGDHEYAVEILKRNPHRSCLFLPLVMSGVDGAPFALLPFVAERRGASKIAISRTRMKRVRQHP